MIHQRKNKISTLAIGLALASQSAYSLSKAELGQMSSAQVKGLMSRSILEGAPAAGYTPEKQPNPRILQRLEIDHVWAGHPVRFDLVTKNGRQYAAYYNSERQMVVAARDLNSTEWDYIALPNKIGWDSHNYITMAVDRLGHIHLSGNMHGDPLLYYKTEHPHDIDSFRQLPELIGEDEDMTTYPEFIDAPNGDLIFTYRQGSSGNGVNIYNTYNPDARQWKRLLDEPLLDGQGKMNAYPNAIVQGPDGYFHLTWVWRDTPDAATNHSLSYIRSKDLVSWETGTGQQVNLPITANTSGVIVDPIPIHGGIINGSGNVGFDHENLTIVSYQKYNEDGITQPYNARIEDSQWTYYTSSDWDYRWNFGGTGTIQVRVRHGAITIEDGIMQIPIGHPKIPNGTYSLNPETLKIEQRIPISTEQQNLENILRVVQSNFEGVNPSIQRFADTTGSGSSYILRRESLPKNRDRPRPQPWPAPSKLELIVIAE